MAVKLSVRYPLQLRNDEDLQYQRGIGVRHEALRFWWNRFGRKLAQ